MWGISSFTATRHAQFCGYTCKLGDKTRLLDFGGIRITMRSQRSQFLKFLSHEFRSHSTRTAVKGPSIRMTLVDERLLHRRAVVKPADILAYDLVQGTDVTWSYIMDKSVPEPPTAVLLHGILGGRKNWAWNIQICQVRYKDISTGTPCQA